jgi:hypothetical protein
MKMVTSIVTAAALLACAAAVAFAQDKPIDSPLAQVGKPSDSPLAQVGTPSDSPLAQVDKPSDSPLAQVDKPSDSPLANGKTGIVSPANAAPAPKK